MRKLSGLVDIKCQRREAAHCQYDGRPYAIYIMGDAAEQIADSYNKKHDTKAPKVGV